MSTPIRKRTVISDEKGNALFDNLPEGEYRLRASKDGYLPYRGHIAVGTGNTRIVVSLVPINKASLSHENERLRATILAATDLRKIGTCISQSNDLIRLSPIKFRGSALKQYRKTAKAARKRINELRSSGDRLAVGATVSAAGEIGGSLEKETKKRPLI